MKFKEFGWNNIFLEVPDEMRFSRQGGNSKNGTFVLEAENYFIEARWEEFDPKKIRPLSDVIDGLVEQMKKKSKKKDLEVKVMAREDTFIGRHKALYAVVRSSVDDRFYLWYCDDSSRIVILRFAFKAFDEDSKQIIRRVVDSFDCHGEKSNIWSVMEVRFSLPRSFLLTDTKVSVGRAHFMFTDQKLSAFTEKTRKLLIEYFSMANLVFKDSYRDLEKWFAQNYLKDLRKKLGEGKVEFKTVESKKIKRHNVLVKKAIKSSGISSRKSSILENLTWYCSGSNRIYSVTAASSVKRPFIFKREIDEEDFNKMMEELMLTFQCHQA
ncbi:MAG: hypothetical protein RMJ07_04115 [Nitrososphaerota archaeon]|nr:hypothetical protein [Candidatus Bathyarchaeota archaeon]MDW8048849.1 hypothetical protein [Nitrososphaerota archaeon]